MKLIFDEHFYNLDNWNFEKGFVRNHELQYYTDRNIELTESGLKIYGKKELVKNESYDNVSSDWTKNREYAEYTSSSINTKNKFSFKYGIFSITPRNVPLFFTRELPSLEKPRTWSLYRIVSSYGRCSDVVRITGYSGRRQRQAPSSFSIGAPKVSLPSTAPAYGSRQKASSIR